MEPEDSLPRSQVPATCPYPEPPRSSPYPPTSYFPKKQLNIILPPTLGSPKWSLSLRFPPPKPCIRLSSPTYALHAPPISFFSILGTQSYYFKIYRSIADTSLSYAARWNDSGIMNDRISIFAFEQYWIVGWWGFACTRIWRSCGGTQTRDAERGEITSVALLKMDSDLCCFCLANNNSMPG